MWRLTNMATVLALLAATSAADSPRSAIPWLSESITEPHASLIPSKPTTGDGRDDTIVTTPLSQINRDTVGLVSPAVTGFSDDVWLNSSALRLRQLILNHPGSGVPEARQIFHNLLLTHAAAPVGSGPRASFFLARVDRLLQIGALDEAREMIEAAGISDPETFRRYFDIGLLTGRAEAACATIQSSPSLSPTLQARVFCLARAGDWDAAALTLSLGTQLGIIPQDQGDLLAFFLDPGLFGDEEEPPIPEPLTALDFVLREAVALPRPSDPLPLAFLQVDLAPVMPMRARIVAGEKLVRSGAISAPRLFAAYRAGVPAASGGVWDRAEALQAVDAAIAGGDQHDILDAIVAVDNALGPFDLRHVLASEYGSILARLPADPRNATQRQHIFELLALDGRADAARRWTDDNLSQTEIIALALATASDIELKTENRLSAIERAVVSGLSTGRATSPQGERLFEMLQQNRHGEAILGALRLVAPGVDVDPGDLETALFILRAAGQQNAARMIALQTLLLRPPA